MKNLLLVPIRTDALFLAEDSMVADATADFSHLPYFNGLRDVNADVANISENVTSQPLADQNMRLRKGLHLHWALPDALNRGRYLENGKTVFPAVPNRWLVTRRTGEAERSWVVESDYLFPEEKALAKLPKDHPMRAARRESVTVPVEISGRESGEQPFRYMGRKMEAAAFDPSEDTERYPNLTTVGYGEPSFAAFYPNCHSVFGFHDPEIAENTGEVSYEIFGWYSDPAQDFLNKLTNRTIELSFENFRDGLPESRLDEAEKLWLALLKKKVLDDSMAREAPPEKARIRPPADWDLSPNDLKPASGLAPALQVVQSAIIQYFQDTAGWALPPGDTFAQGQAPAQTVLCSRIVLNTTGQEGRLSQTEAEGISIAIGNTGTEALSAYLARRLSGRTEMDFAAFSKLIPSSFEGNLRFREDAWENLHQSGWLRPIPGKDSVAEVTADRPPLPPTMEKHRERFLQVFSKLPLSFNLPENGTSALEMEEQLEALYLLDKLNHRMLDLDAKFDEARHENGFNARASGHLWTISIENPNNAAADAPKEANKPELNSEIAGLLNKINTLQTEYDRSHAELESLGTQLFADWYKYMMSTYPPEDTRTDYPDIDEVRFFIEEQVMNPLLEKEAQTGQLDLARPEDLPDGKNPANGTGSNALATARQLAGHINDLFQKLHAINASLPAGSSFFVLKRVGGPRYYQPKEPVVLLVNDEANNPVLQPTRRHGQDGRLRSDGLLDVQVVGVNGEEPYLRTPAALENLRPHLPAEGIGYTEWNGQPWNPFRLDWELELVPLGKGTNIEEGEYNPDFLTKTFRFSVENNQVEAAYFSLPLNSPDLVPKHHSAAKFQGRNPNIYLGKSLLTPQAKRNLHDRLENFLKENLPGEDLTKYTADSALSLQKATELGGPGNPVATALLAFSHLKNDNLHLLSQAFSGFNDALIQLRQTLQLPIADPIGFLDYQGFTTAVARLAENSTLLAPQPLTDFNPIRNGKLIINQLRLVDTFGQVRDIGLGKLDRVLGAGTSPAPTLAPNSKIEIPLQPRLAQPARLNFRWLNASEGTLEMNAVPSTSPICGWILTNQLDDSIVVYDANGLMLGSIEAEEEREGIARWNPAPGALKPFSAERIPNIYLRKMVKKIRSGGALYVAQFLDGLDAALQGIEPEGSEARQALSLLIGRPVALVRASLNLELQGMPAVDQGWKSFYDDRTDQNFDRKKDGFTKVKFPVRIGEFSQFNDGLIGFWKEDGEGNLSQQFYLNQLPLQNINHPEITMLEDTGIPVYQSIDDAPQLVSLLLDPRGKVHVTTGILPVKEMDIPAEQYLPAMQRMGVTFLTSPLLSTAANIRSLLPMEEGFQWSWLEKRGDTWREVWQYPTIERGDFMKTLSGKILEQLLLKNWIAPAGQGAFFFRPEEEHLLLDGQFQPADTDLFGILNEISQDQILEDGTVEYFFLQTDFEEKISAENDLGEKAWNRLVRSDVRWCQFIPDRPETFVILPPAERSAQVLEGIGMEFLIEEILKAHSQVLLEPEMGAQPNGQQMTIREGYLKLETVLR